LPLNIFATFSWQPANLAAAESRHRDQGINLQTARSFRLTTTAVVSEPIDDPLAALSLTENVTPKCRSNFFAFRS
jgi:hypothetical protein